MDETKIERTPTSTHTTIDRTVAQPSGGNGMMWFLLGGVVVVVAIIAYFVLGNGDLPATSASQPTDGNVSINVDTSDTPPADAAPAEAAPADPAPEETAPAAD